VGVEKVIKVKKKELESYRKNWKIKRNKKVAELENRRKRAKEIARKCGEILREKYGVNSVYLVGSTVFSDKIHPRSDIDLLVRGLSDESYFKALRDCWNCLPPDFELDIICWKDAPDSLKARARKKGEEIS